MLERKTTACVILHMKSIVHTSWNSRLARKRQYAVRKSRTQRLRKGMGIKLTNSRPRCPQSNSQSERAVQTMKNMLKKANAEGRYPYLALLANGNTAVAGMS